MIDRELLEQAKSVGGHRTYKGAAAAALSEYIDRRKQLEIIKLFGTIEFHSDYDYRKLRRKPRT